MRGPESEETRQVRLQQRHQSETAESKEAKLG